MKRADTLTVDYKIKGDTFVVPFNIDSKIKGDIKIRFPFALDGFDESLYSYLAMSCAAVLASLSLPKKIIFSFPVYQKKAFDEVFKILYDVRCYSEEIDFFVPELKALKTNRAKTLPLNFSKKSASLFWSGGLDSTYSYILLKKNGYEVNLIHSDINQDTSSAEKKAVVSISKNLGIDFEHLYIEFPLLKKIGRQYSQKFSVYPYYNSIPFGRDIIHVFAGLFFNLKHKTKCICFGHENELWGNYIYFKGKKICRNDFQSEKGTALLDSILKKISPQLHIFSPVAALSKYRVYNSLMNYNKDILKKTTSCYFGSDCGECLNCLLYRMLTNIFFKKVPTDEELITFLDASNTIKKETFATMHYLGFYDTIKEEMPREIRIKLKEKFGHLLAREKESIIDDLEKINKVKLTPSDFIYQ
jgi:7-cyano-7-deazaguanine synthase in queuosine biosynthesis